jgi:hypothetical protein
MIIINVMKKKYFQPDKQYYKQTEGLAMGTLISAMLAEVYISNIWIIDNYIQF